MLLALLVALAISLQLCSAVDLNDYYSWIVKSVCASDLDGHVLAWDPYYSCPAGSSLRKLKPGEAFPYNNYEQMGYQISDSFGLLDSSAKPIYLHTFDYAPFNEFNQHSGSDGYDIYSINANTVSYSNTKDGGGYGSTFFGKSCSFGNGWALFPTTNFTSASQGYWPISGIYWEQQGKAYPGPCPSGYSTDTLTSWSLKKGFEFGGINGNPTKIMDTIVSFHGFETSDGETPTSNFLKQGHLEVFYFTAQYGITRWEVWAPASTSSQASSLSECSGSANVIYKNQNFNIIDCHDWSNVKVLTTPVLPAWPIVNANLLKFFHFDSSRALVDGNADIGYWHRFGSINWSLLTSSSSSDANNGPGVKYIAVNCGASSGTDCPGTQGSNAMYQDILISEIQNFDGNQRILFGANVHTDSGKGVLQLALQLLDSAKNVIWQDVVENELSADNGDGRPGEADSQYRSSKFMYKVANVPFSPAGFMLRFLVLPKDTNTFNIVDCFVNYFPK